MNKQAGNSKKTPIDVGRRRLMSGAIGVSVAAGLGVVGLNAQAAPAVEKTPDTKSTTYRETEHIRRYYRSAQ